MEVKEVVNIAGDRRHFDTKLCIVCQEYSTCKVIVKSPAVSSLTKLLDSLIARVDEKAIYRERVADLAAESGSSLKGKNCIYHRQCFQQVTNKNTFQRFFDRREKRLSATCEPEPNVARPTRSSTNIYDRSKCFFCQTVTDENLFNLRTFNRSNRIKDAIEKSQNDMLRIRFNSFSDAHAGDVKYHCKCMVSHVDKVLAEDCKEKRDVLMAARYGVDEELTNTISDGIAGGSIYQMSDICSSYLTMLQASGIIETRSEKYIKQYIKKLLTEEIEDIVFEKSPQRNVSAKVYSAKFSSTILDGAIEEVLSEGKSNMKYIAKAARVARCAALEAVRNAEKNFDTAEGIHENEVPVELYNMIKWILGGFNSLHSRRDDAVATISKSICNTILYNIKSNRHVSYRPTTETTFFRNRYENSHKL